MNENIKTNNFLISRYNFSAEVGKAMDLDVTSSPLNWREQAIKALEEAILYSFQV